MAAPVIEARDLGVRFNRNTRQARRSFREVVTGRNRQTADEFWAVRDVSFSVK